MNKTKKGISLIVLVITIIIILILMAATFISYLDVTPVENAKEVAFKSDIEGFKVELSTYIQNQRTENFGEYNSDNLNASNENKEGFIDIGEVIPSIKGTEYEDKFDVVEGELVYKGNEPKEKEWAEATGIKKYENVKVVISDVVTGINDLTGKVTVNGEITASDIKEYIVNIGTISGTYETEEKVNGGSLNTNFSADDLKEGTRYYIKVEVVKQDGTIIESNEIVCVTKTDNQSSVEIAENPGIPRIISVNNVKSDTWIKDSALLQIIYDSDNPSEDEVSLLYKENNGELKEYDGQILISNEGITKVVPNAKYNGKNTQGNEYIVKIDKTAPEIINVSTRVFENSIFVSVEAQDKLSGIKGYMYSSDGGKTWSEITTNTSYEFTGLDFGTEYEIQVKVVDNVGNEKIESLNITSEKSEPILQSWTYTDTTDFHNSIYKEKITKVILKNDINIPSSAIDSWDVSEAKDGGVIAYIEDDLNGGYIVTIGGDGKIIANENSSYMFSGFRNLIEIENLSILDTSNVTNMSSMFNYCESITGIDVSNFNTSNVTNMAWMFYGCYKLREIDVSKFNTSNVIYMNSMFDGCISLENLDLSNWNTSKVTRMAWMFNICSGLKSIDVSKFDTSNVTDMTRMFHGCTSLENLDLSNWNTSNVTDMSDMFNSCVLLTSIGDLSRWDTSNVKDMSYMFNSCSSLTSIGNLSGWDTSNVKDMSYMFNSCSSLTSIGNLSGWDTSNVTNMNSMFYGCTSLENLDLSNWNTSNVTIMWRMFFNCSSLTSIGDIGNWNTSKVNNMSYMFYGCNNLTYIGNLNNWNTSNVTNMSSMFYDCRMLTTTIPILGNNVTDYSYMFSNAATKNGAKITVNYTQETSSLVDNMIATKSTNSNVVKGSQVTAPIILMSLFSDNEIVTVDEADISVTKVDEKSIYLNVNDMDGISKINLLNEKNEIVDEILVDGDIQYKNLVNIENKVMYVQVVDMNNVKTSISI